MASPSPSSSASGSKVKNFRKSLLLRVVAAGLLILLLRQIYAGSGGCSSKGGETPSTEKPKPVEQKVTKVLKIKLDPEKWSEWISLVELKPPEVPDDARCEGQVNAPGWHEFRFTNGKTTLIPDKSWNEEESKRSLGTIYGSTFKLRGEEGEAVIRIEYIFFK